MPVKTAKAVLFLLPQSFSYSERLYCVYSVYFISEPFADGVLQSFFIVIYCSWIESFKKLSVCFACCCCACVSLWCPKFYCLLLKASSLAWTGEVAPWEGWDETAPCQEQVREGAAIAQQLQGKLCQGIWQHLAASGEDLTKPLSSSLMYWVKWGQREVLCQGRVGLTKQLTLWVRLL